VDRKKKRETHQGKLKKKEMRPSHQKIIMFSKNGNSQKKLGPKNAAIPQEV